MRPVAGCTDRSSPAHPQSLVVSLLAFLLVSPTLFGQNPAQTAPYRVSTHLVQFGVIVRDKSGPVRNLTKDDFVVFDRGKPQTITVFSVESAASTSQSAQPLPANTFSDESRYATSLPRTVTIILLDNLNTLFGSDPQPYEETPHWLEDHALGLAKQRLTSFLRQMDPQDRVAIYGLTNRLRVLCDFTCSRDQLLAVVGRYDATSQTAREGVDPQNFHLPNVPEAFNQAIDEDTRELAGINNSRRAAITMSALTAIAAHVSDIPGRKNLLWLTANLPFSAEAIAAVLARGDIAAYPVDARELLPAAPVITVNTDNAFARQSVTAPLGHASVPIGVDTMIDVAADTGGHAFVNTNDLTSAIRTVVEDSAVTYTLGFYLPERAVDGKFHKLAVAVKEPGLTLNYPRGYFAAEDADTSRNESHDAFLAAVRSPLDSSAVPVDVRLNRVDQPVAHSVQIVGVIGIGSVRMPQTGDERRGLLEIYTIQQDAAGDVLDQTNQRLDLNFTEQQYRTYLHSGVLFHTLVQTKPDAAVLRVLVQDPGSAEVGCVIIPLAQIH